MTVISVENLSKSYRLGQIGTGTLTNDLKVWWAKARGKPNPLLKIGQKDHGNRHGESIWALKDVSFEVKQGEVLGIIGRNGAGKSTLLKILTGVTAPTSGQIKAKGRVASLLEVGTGFHPELTGRENIYLNGAILGMKKAEIARKFSEIVAFSEVEQFIDTPVKRYSSGMYVRLAFAVAAHLDPEILLVDEVLAVGDAEFQKKCLGKMGDVARGGRTVLFVSHNMGAIRQLCGRSILLDHGQVALTGETTELIGHYLRGTGSPSNGSSGRQSRFLLAIEFLDSSFHRVNSMLAGSGGTFRIPYDTGVDVITDVYVTIAVYDLVGTKVVQLSTVQAYEKQTIERMSGKGHLDCQMAEMPLAPGQYRVNVALDGSCATGAFHDGIVDGLELVVLPSDYYGPSHMRASGEGFVMVKHRWVVTDDSAACVLPSLERSP